MAAARLVFAARRLLEATRCCSRPSEKAHRPRGATLVSSSKRDAGASRKCLLASRRSCILNAPQRREAQELPGGFVRHLLCSLTLFCALAGPLLAQESRATLIGRATDPTGAILANATVRA